MATDLEKAWKIVSGHRSFIGPDDVAQSRFRSAMVARGIGRANVKVKVVQWRLTWKRHGR
jgi:hypothetical protein